MSNVGQEPCEPVEKSMILDSVSDKHSPRLTLLFHQQRTGNDGEFKEQSPRSSDYTCTSDGQGTYLAVLNGCDGIVLTGGIGENGSIMRKRILKDMENIGIVLDDEKNNKLNGKEGEIQKDNSKIKIFIIPTNEEKAIALDTYNIIKKS